MMVANILCAQLKATQPAMLALLSKVSDHVQTMAIPPIAVHKKTDGSPVTAADLWAHEALTEGLQALGMEVPILSEEGCSGIAQDNGDYWLIDPIDGTRSFVRGEPYYVVNIAYIHRGIPLLGAIAAPAFSSIYFGVVGHGVVRVKTNALDEPTTCHLIPLEAGCGWRVLTSSRTVSEPFATWLARHSVHSQHNVPSAYKFCLMLEGKADVYARRGTVHSWDVAAGHALICAAGGQMVTAQRQPLIYSATATEVRGFVAHVPGVEFHPASW